MASFSNPFVDNAIALRLLLLLTTPFKEMDAYKAGIIDEKGKYIVPPNKRTNEQKRSLTYLDKLIINVKKVINKLPGGENNLKNLVSAMIFIKENLEHENAIILSEENIAGLYDNPKYETSRNRFIHTWCDYLKIKEECGVAAMSGGSTNLPTNNTTGIAWNDSPMPFSIFRRRNNPK